MERLESREEVRQAVAEARRDGATVALVPTMGALHDGHLSLVRAARSRADVVAVSIFVNPTQFAPGEDLDAYPRDLPGDLAKLEAEGISLVFTPSVAEMCPPDATTSVEPGSLAAALEGAVRPTHFAGVATIVAKLFATFMPDLAMFGEKDYQQLLVVRRMVRDLDFPVSVVGCPIVRELSGLAMSSRNAYLSPEQRGAAPVIYRALTEAVRKAGYGQPSVAAIEGAMTEALAYEPLVVPDYAVVRDAETLQPIEHLEPGRPARALIAARLGATRLIDNIAVELGQRPQRPAWPAGTMPTSPPPGSAP